VFSPKKKEVGMAGVIRKSITESRLVGKMGRQYGNLWDKMEREKVWDKNKM